jgi:hypothetical protein
MTDMLDMPVEDVADVPLVVVAQPITANVSAASADACNE